MNADKTGQTPNPSGQAVKHDTTAHRFEVIVDGFSSVLDYVPVEGGVIMTHTFVPAELRGRGIAEQLARAALDYARSQGHRVNPQCSYIARFIERHREYQSLLVQ